MKNPEHTFSPTSRKRKDASEKREPARSSTIKMYLRGCFDFSSNSNHCLKISSIKKKKKRILPALRSDFFHIKFNTL